MLERSDYNSFKKGGRAQITADMGKNIQLQQRPSMAEARLVYLRKLELLIVEMFI